MVLSQHVLQQSNEIVPPWKKVTHNSEDHQGCLDTVHRRHLHKEVSVLNILQQEVRIVRVLKVGLVPVQASNRVVDYHNSDLWNERRRPIDVITKHLQKSPGSSFRDIGLLFINRVERQVNELLRLVQHLLEFFLRSANEWVNHINQKTCFRFTENLVKLCLASTHK